jgi:hypothetical protein
MKTFQRLDHLLCDVPDIDAAFDLFHNRLGFPVAWPIGRYWPQGKTCGLALGGVNLEFIQTDGNPVTTARIQTIAFEPTDRIQEMFDREGIPFKRLEKWESDDSLLRMRGLPTGQGAQLLCTNYDPGEYAIEFSFFACKYSITARRKLLPQALPVPSHNAVEQVVLGHPDPSRLTEQFRRLGIEEGVRLSVVTHAVKEVVAIVMKNGPLDLGDWPARFRFVGPS